MQNAFETHNIGVSQQSCALDVFFPSKLCTMSKAIWISNVYFLSIIQHMMENMKYILLNFTFSCYWFSSLAL